MLSTPYPSPRPIDVDSGYEKSAQSNIIFGAMPPIPPIKAAPNFRGFGLRLIVQYNKPYLLARSVKTEGQRHHLW